MNSELNRLFSGTASTPSVAPARSSVRVACGKSITLFLLVLLGLSRSYGVVPFELSASIVGHTPAYPTYEVNYFTDNNLSTDYASNGGGVATHVDFQFSGPVAVGYAVYTDRTSSGFFNGSYWAGPHDNVYSYKLIFSNEPTFTSVLWEQEYASPGYANTDPAALVNGGYGVTAEYVRWQVTSTEGGNPGGAELHFFTPEMVPEPAVGVLFGLAAILFARKFGNKS